MKQEIYLIATRNGVERMTKRQPSLGRFEVAVRLEVEIPNDCFRSPIVNVGNVTISADDVMQPTGSVRPKRKLDLSFEGGANGEKTTP